MGVGFLRKELLKGEPAKGRTTQVGGPDSGYFGSSRVSSPSINLMGDNEGGNTTDETTTAMLEADDEIFPMSWVDWRSLIAELRMMTDPAAVAAPTGVSSSSKPLFTKTVLLNCQFDFNNGMLSILESVPKAMPEHSNKDSLSEPITKLAQLSELLVVADKELVVLKFYDQRTRAECLQDSKPILVDSIRTQKKEARKLVSDRSTM